MFDEEAYLSGLDGYVQHARKEFEDRLKALVEVPTVSMEPERKGDVRRGAELAARMIREFGGTATVFDTPGHPVVVGTLGHHDGAPTLTVYNHIDVQPADPGEWQHPPFQFHVEGDRYDGRGTTDDKGPALTALFAARYAQLQGLPLNVRFLWELEEEIGSPNFDAFVAEHARELETDSILVSDTVWIARDRPAIPYGLRGLLGVIMRLETGEKSTHSGTTGGMARNPIGELAEVIARCYDARTGEVLIPGFYDPVRRPTETEVEDFVASGFDVGRFKDIYRFKSVRSDENRDAVLRLMARPTFEVHGVVGGYSGPGVKTIVPHKAEAKISMRLVPDMTDTDTFKLVSDFVMSVNPDVQVTQVQYLPPFLGERDSRYNQAAADAVEAGFGRRPVFTREGGSIGAVLSMHRHLKAPIVFIGMSLPEHGYHEPDENYDWGQAAGGMKTFAQYMLQLTKLPQETAASVY